MKIAVVTGANKGIGLEITKGLLAEDFRVILACRNPKLGEEAASRCGERAQYVGPLDLDDETSVAGFMDKLRGAGIESFDVLVNCAAIAFKKADTTPHAQQAEPTLRPNFFNTAKLTNSLLPMLKSSDGGKPRIVNVASFAGKLSILQDGGRKNRLEEIIASKDESALFSFASEFVKDTSEGRHKEKGWPGTCYGFSKLCLIAYTKILAMKSNGDIVVNCVCPGWCATDMSSHSGPRTAEKGAETPVFLATSASVTSSGGFYQDLQEVQW
jgi:carbonyl reductase 1